MGPVPSYAIKDSFGGLRTIIFVDLACECANVG